MSQITAAVSKKRKRTRRTVMLRVDKDQYGHGIFRAADAYSRSRIEAKKYRVGQLVTAEMVQSRNPGYFRKGHALMTVVIENVDCFSHLVPKQDEHQLLKRLQIEAQLCCDEIAIDGGIICLIPQSLNFEDMKEEEFDSLYKGLISHLANNYWPDCTEEAVDLMANFADSAA